MRAVAVSRRKIWEKGVIMKRFTALLVLVLMIVLMTGVITALAGSASATISGAGSVEAGKTYTYTYKLSVSSACAANLNISVGGAFEKVSGGEGLFHDSIPNNTSKTYSGSVRVRVKSGASPGEKGTISASGGYSYLDADYNESSGSVSKSFSAKVTAPSTPAPPATPTPQPSVKKTTKPKATTKPSAANTPDSTATPTATPAATLTPAPTPTPELTGWAKALLDVSAMPDGGKVTVTQPENTQLPAEVLTALKAKGGVLDADFGTYSCEIDGSKLGNLPPSLTTLDLGMSMEKDDALSATAEEADAYQLHFSYSGELPGPVTVSFAVPDHSPGDTLYLYYYYEVSGAVEVRQAATVDKNGRVSFVIYHCSAYFVTDKLLDSSAGLVASIPDASSATAPTSVPSLADDGAALAASKVGSQTGRFSLTMLLIVGVGALVLGAAGAVLTRHILETGKRKREGKPYRRD